MSPSSSTPFKVVGGALVLAAFFAHGDGTLGGVKWLALHVFFVACCMWIPRLRQRDWFAIGLFGYAALSLWWSADPLQGAYQLLNAAGLLGVFIAAPYLNVRAIATMGLVVAVALGLISPEFFGGFGNENFLASFILIAMPLVGVWALPAGFYLVFANGSHLEWGVLLAVCLYFLWRWNRLAGLGAFALLVGGVVFMFSNVVHAPIDGIWWSVSGRVELWANTFKLWLEAPLFGHGFGSFMHEFPRVMEWFPVVHQDGMGRHAGGAHNEYLQLLSELGLVGLILCLPLLRGVSLAPLFVAGVLAFVDLPLQNAPTAILVALILGSGRGLVWGSVVPVEPRLRTSRCRPF